MEAELHPPFHGDTTLKFRKGDFYVLTPTNRKALKKMLGGSRAGVDGVGDPLVGRTAARRVELDAEVLIRATGVVAAGKKNKKKTRTIIPTYTGGPFTCCNLL